MAFQQVATGNLLLDGLSTAETSIESIVLVDLSMPNVNVDPDVNLDIVGELKTIDHPPKAIIAYGPHVAEGKLAAAKDAGCDQILTRGQAHRDIATVLAQYL